MQADGTYVIDKNLVVKVSGVEAAQKQVYWIERNWRRTILRKSMRAAVGVLAKGIRSRLPYRRTGALGRSVYTTVRLYDRGTDVVGIAGVGRGVDKRTKRDRYYAQFLEGGTGEYGPKKRAYTIKAQPGKALSWRGAAHPVQQVTIRGIRPMHFTKRTAEQDMPKANVAFAAEFDRQIALYWKA